MEYVLGVILNLLDNNKDRNTFSLVCRTWYKADSDNRIHVQIRNSMSVQPQRVLERFPNLRSITLRGTCCDSSFSAWLEAFLSRKHTHLLEKVDLKKIVVTDDNLLSVSLSFKGFKALTLNSCSGFTIKGLEYIAAKCRNLEVLSVQRCDSLEHSERCWFTSLSDKLVSFDASCIKGVVDKNDMVQLVGRSPNLRTLTLNETLSRPRPLLEIVSVSTGLEMLGLLVDEYGGNNEEVTNTECGLLSAELQYRKSIRSLAISDSKQQRAAGVNGVCREYLMAFTPVQKQLVYLNFNGLTAVSTTDQMAFIVECTNLEMLHVTSRIGDEGVQGIGRFCKKLEALVVLNKKREGRITEVGFNCLARGCPLLNSLSIFCSRINCDSLREFSRKRGDMRCLKLYVATGRWDRKKGGPLGKAFVDILDSCRNLQKLRVPGPFSKKLLDSIVENGKSLEVLQLAGGDWEGNGTYVGGLRQVIGGCKHLKKLSILGGVFGGDDIFGGRPMMKSLFISRSGDRMGDENDMVIKEAIHSVETDYTRSHEFVFNCYYIDGASDATTADYQRVYLKEVFIHDNSLPY